MVNFLPHCERATYGVTCDEILRGRRNGIERTVTANAEEKSQKRLEYLLNKVRMGHKIHSLIVLCIGIVGFFLAMLLNFSCNRGTFAFFTGTLFISVSLILQMIFGIRAKASMEGEEFSESNVYACKKALLRYNQFVYTTAAVLYAMILPFVFVPDPYLGLAFQTWCSIGGCLTFVTLAVSLLICRVVWVRRGFSKGIDWKKPINRLRMRIVSAFLLTVVLLFAFQVIFYSFLESRPDLLTDYDSYEEWEDFLEVVESPVSPEGRALTFVEGYGDYLVYEDSDGVSYLAIQHEMDFAGENRAFYWKNNMIVKVYTIRTAICVLNRRQFAQAENIRVFVMWGYCSLYVVATVVWAVIYRKKKTLLNHGGMPDEKGIQ